MYSIEVVTPPTVEPVDLQTFKDHARIYGTDDDAICSAYLTAARQLFEAQTGMSIMATTYRLNLNSWSDTIYLMRHPFVSLTSVQYVDTNGVSQTAAGGTDYDLDAKSTPAVVKWRTSPQLHPYQMPKVWATFSAGYASADQVPALIRQGILLLAADWYERREANTTDKLAKFPGFAAIVGQYYNGFVSTMGMG
jgi:uncharacterized phiE125 gp8 family phage protein